MKNPPPIAEWLKGLSSEEREKLKTILSKLGREEGMEFLTHLLGRPVTKAEYLLVLGELGIKSKGEEAGKEDKGGGKAGKINWEDELEWLYSQVKERIVLGRGVEEREGVPLPSVDKMVEVASRLVEIALKYKSGEKDLYSLLNELAESGGEGEPGGEGGEES
jgi:hypothetical protein